MQKWLVITSKQLVFAALNLIGQEHFWPLPTEKFQITFYVPTIYLSM